MHSIIAQSHNKVNASHGEILFAQAQWQQILGPWFLFLHSCAFANEATFQGERLESLISEVLILNHPALFSEFPTPVR
ncbi:unnamed protein product [Cuscuta campestris]|uniref:Uncharacterized protein n=1 Tax=Cuscuta campestris TaxID=132261 RepID=A0A484MU44_9ASTE|nr:unnamed protein product [Cuscuta campestris]